MKFEISAYNLMFLWGIKKRLPAFADSPGWLLFATAPVTPSSWRLGRSVFYKDLTFPDPEDVLLIWGSP